MLGAGVVLYDLAPRKDIRFMEKKRINLAPGALTAPLPPAIVTVGDMEYSNALTVAWTGIISTVPPRTYISVRPSRHSYGILKERGEFVINLPSAEMAREVDFIGIYTGKKMDKIERCGLTRVKSEKVLVPTIAECPLSLECRVFEILEMGSHNVFLADIVSISCREDIMNEDGRLMMERAGLLAYAHGEYFSLGEKLGKFGFSTDKESKKIIGKANKKTSVLGREKALAKKKPARQSGADSGAFRKEKPVQQSESGSGAFSRKKQTQQSESGLGAFGKRKTSDSGFGAFGKEKPSGAGEKPFYAGLARGKKKKVPEGQKDKGRPHGKRVKDKEKGEK